MAKNSITDYSKTAASNTDIQSVDIAEGCLPSGINNAIREIMADLADMNDGTVTLTSPSFAAASLTGNLSFGDSDKAIFGAGSDLEIYHNGTDSFIDEKASGWLYIRANDMVLGKYTGETYVKGIADGAVELYHDNAKKIETTSTGIDVTGAVTADGLTVDTNTLHVDSTNNRVGIGTSSPLSKLNVKGTQGNWRVDPDSVSGEIQVLSTTPANDGFRTFRLRSNESIFETGGSERLRIDSSGNIGIGTSSPDRQLSVNNFSGNGTVSINASTTGASTLYFADGNTGTDIYTGFIQYNHSSNAMQFATNGGSERMRIDSSGNVGIGTSSPNANLGFSIGSDIKISQVAGTAHQSGNAGSIGLTISDGGNHSGVFVNNSHDGTYSDQFITFNTAEGGVSASTERMRIDSSGRVGIGTSSPAAPLHVVGNSYVQSGTFYTDAITAFSGSSININAGSSHLSATVNGSERMRIDSSGVVLVGTTSTGRTTVGHELHASGFARHTADGDKSLEIVRKSSDGEMVEFFKDSTLVGSIGVVGGTPFFSNNNNSTGIRIYSSGFAACNASGAFTDNTQDVGASNVRWDDIYATNGTIQTSDQNEKQDIEALSEAEQRVAVAAKGLLRKFRWKDSVEEKGDDARIHFGIIAQDLQAAFEAEGLDAGRYAMFINSTWTDEETGEERSRMGVRYNQLLAFIIAAI